MLAQSLSAVVSQLLCRVKEGGGRVPSFEILLSHEALPATIREGLIANIRSIIEGGGGAGMQTMDSHLMRLVKEERISGLEAYMKAGDKAEFERFIDTAALHEMTL